MEQTIKYAVASALIAALLGACASPTHRTLPAHNVYSAESPHIQSKPASVYLAPLSGGRFGERTVDEVLQAYGPYSAIKLNPYFAKANVSYPPREIALVAFKREKKLELWARDNGEFRLIRDYPILAASGVSGPKLRQGDRQVPEGIYRIEALNPNSNYHLSMRLNYPNEFDRFHAREEGRIHPGSDIFIHGRSYSIGCLAMGDEVIEELFVLTAQVGLENVKVVIAPYDPRFFALRADPEIHPSWTPELYSIISDELKAIFPVPRSASGYEQRYR